MRQHQAQLVADGPSTSGRCFCAAPVAYSRRRGRLVIANQGHMPITMYNQQPLANFKPQGAGGVVKGARTTATPRLTPERVRLGAIVAQITFRLPLLSLRCCCCSHCWQGCACVI